MFFCMFNGLTFKRLNIEYDSDFRHNILIKLIFQTIIRLIRSNNTESSLNKRIFGNKPESTCDRFEDSGCPMMTEQEMGNKRDIHREKAK